MTARTTLILIALAVAMTACNRSQPEREEATLDLSVAAAEVPLTSDPIEADATTVTAEPLEELLTASVESEEVLSDESAEAAVALVEFKLRHGETLHHFARWARLPVETVAEASGLDLSGDYSVGQTVSLPIEGDLLSQVIASRDAHHVRRAEGYLAGRGGALGSEFVTVRSGDSAWSIAHDQQGIPIWLLETYNPSVDLERLRPGQQLMVPVIADIVVDAEDLEPYDGGF